MGKRVLRYGHFSVFWSFLWAKMAKLSLVDFKIGLPINPYVNDGQNKLLEVDI